MGESVSVKWWNHRKAIYEAVCSLQYKEIFADVTLVCENKKVQAHKFVLSACSEYFENQLRDIPFRGSFFLPAEISEINLMSLLDYIYRGEAIVEEERVDELLKAAEILKMRGLVIPSHSTASGVESEVESNGIKENRDDLSSSLTLVKKRKSTEEMVSSSDCEVVDDSQYVNGILKVVIKKNLKGHVSSRDVHNDRRSNPDPKLVCPHCQRQFYWRSNLTKHIRTHTGEKPYTCPECSYKTGYSEALKRHIRVHTGEKPYECSLCDYKCKDNNSLKLHMNKHTGESSFSCEYCTYKTRIKSAFYKHLMANHDYNDLPLTDLASTSSNTQYIGPDISLINSSNETHLAPLRPEHPNTAGSLHSLPLNTPIPISSGRSDPIASVSHNSTPLNDPYAFNSRAPLLSEASHIHLDNSLPISSSDLVYPSSAFALHPNSIQHPSSDHMSKQMAEIAKAAPDTVHRSTYFETKAQVPPDLQFHNTKVRQ